ncbi:MAG TPA: hypothetical protein VFQ82_02315 [Stellaceae bacterium]|jgi:hypothetical protein|nr:hypothetical protein [Stellaceae bacterium]
MSKQALATLVAALVFAGGALAQPMPTDPSAAANVRQSQRYEQVLRSNPSFAKKRMQEECGPITDPQLHAQCVASFGQSGR